MPNHSSNNIEAPQLSALGALVRDARKTRGWTLEETAKKAEVSRSTLSKIENNQTRPSFEIVNKISKVLDIKRPQLFLQSGTNSISGRRDVTKHGQGEVEKTKTYNHELLCTELISKKMVPYVSTINARDISEFDEFICHQGEEFMYVLSGEIIFHTEHYKPLAMKTGDSIYYDSAMGHGCISTSQADAQVLWVSLEV